MAANKHAQHNSRALMNGRPITLKDPRLIADPNRLYDCCLETNGAAAMILTTAEIARDFTDTPVYLSASVQGSRYRQGNVVDGLWHDDFMGSKLLDDGRSAVRGSGMGPEEIDCGQFYESFTGQVPTSFEDHKLCAVGEGGRLEAKQVADPDAPHAGAFPINTSGGNLSEAYTHGFNLAVEAVRQLCGDSLNPVGRTRTCIVAAGPASVPISSAIFCN